MNALSLRIKYKSETGFAPTYGRIKGEQRGSCNYQGGLTHEYAVWMQSLQRGDEWKQHKYQRSTGHHATYYKNGLVFFTKEYKQWLEDEFCRYQTWLEYHNMSYRWD